MSIQNRWTKHFPVFTLSMITRIGQYWSKGTYFGLALTIFNEVAYLTYIVLLVSITHFHARFNCPTRVALLQYVRLCQVYRHSEKTRVRKFVTAWTGWMILFLTCAKYSRNCKHHWLINWALHLIECLYPLSPGHSQGSGSVVLIRHYGRASGYRPALLLALHPQPVGRFLCCLS